MFDISWGNLLVLAVAGLFILGPERLPGAAAWLGRTVRQIRQYASGAQQQLRSELGPEFDELRRPLEDLRSLREFHPRRMVTSQLLGDINDLPREITLTRNGTNGYGAPPAPPVSTPMPAPQRPLLPGERPPFDPDAT
ncbi:Sec-independent protein translocase protein TatB [Gandjariella thermophila]|uniref:Sec-independent protein translocase protein TatB n=1 Tax=Gandjariella thermophila TaxID=1931992 RepID=A0A4D4J7Z5_9PSEU|nr:Sec-independent protein translocase protein TatB [Gandjariella thermophila]GDY29993.1 sec-independent protein translocase protein TatB [Gandjariella thermophila]